MLVVDGVGMEGFLIRKRMMEVDWWIAMDWEGEKLVFVGPKSECIWMETASTG